MDVTLEEFLILGFPLQNVWDCMGLVYSLCKEDVRSPRHAQFHLLQFRLMMGALRTAKAWYRGWMGPTNVNGVWDAEAAPNRPFLRMAVAPTCIGRQVEKEEMARIRMEFMGLLTRAFQVDAPALMPPDCPNPPGNYPEWFSWVLICREPGSFQSLCFDMEFEL